MGVSNCNQKNNWTTNKWQQLRYTAEPWEAKVHFNQWLFNSVNISRSISNRELKMQMRCEKPDWNTHFTLNMSLRFLNLLYYKALLPKTLPLPHLYTSRSHNMQEHVTTEMRRHPDCNVFHSQLPDISQHSNGCIKWQHKPSSLKHSSPIWVHKRLCSYEFGFLVH